MDETNKRDDIDAEIDRVFLTGNRIADPAAVKSAERLRAKLKKAKPSTDAVRQFLADDSLVSAFIEETRQDIDATIEKRHAKVVGRRLDSDYQAKAAIPLLLANSEKTLADIERMHAQLTSLLSAVQDEQAKMAATAADLKQTSAQIVAHTAEMKAVSDQTKIDVPKILAEATAANGKLELWPTLRTAIITACVLTPFTIGTSIFGNELTPAVDRVLSWMFGWKSAPPTPPTVNLDTRQYWIVMPSQDKAPAFPRVFDRAFIIPQEASPHHRPHRVVITHPKVRAHKKTPR